LQMNQYLYNQFQRFLAFFWSITNKLRVQHTHTPHKICQFLIASNLMS
jgi:hypothetical protein